MHSAKDFAGFREADKIIAYLEDPTGNYDLNKTLRDKLDYYRMIYNLKLEHKTDKHIMGVLYTIHGLKEKAARKHIRETEYVFSKVVKVNKAFEKAYMLEASRKNMQLAFATKKVDLISKALVVHQKIVGEDEDESMLPDFSKFEAHTYNMVIPKEIIELVQGLMSQGAINLSDVIPSKMVETALGGIEEAEEVEDAD